MVAGSFLGEVQHNDIKWCCMFGEVEVSAEVLTRNVLRCHAPSHPPGRVPFYVTRSDRLACSEIREFEYRDNFKGDLNFSWKTDQNDALQLQIRFAKILSIGMDRNKLCFVENCPKCTVKEFFSVLNEEKNEWEKMERSCATFQSYYLNPRDILIQKLLKTKLYEWLLTKSHEDGKGPNVLDEDGQGVIHFAAALGYEWAMKPIIAVGVSPNFRDAHGWTALHWAAYFGRLVFQFFYVISFKDITFFLVVSVVRSCRILIYPHLESSHRTVKRGKTNVREMFHASSV